MLSIVIPAKNEENYLPKLLDSIKKQDYKDYEVIVADGGSTDNTKKIARKYGCRVVVGKKKGSPSIERNKGARKAKGDVLLFLDADVRLTDGFLSGIVENISEKNLDVGSCFFRPYDGNWLDGIIVSMSNFLLNLFQRLWPHAYGWCIFSKKNVHDKLGGFNEEIFVGEDHDYAIRASKMSNFGIVKSVVALSSMRRYHKEGRLKVTLKYAFMEFHRLFRSEVKGKKIDYSFDYKK